MASQVDGSKQVLDRFSDWADQYRNGFLTPYTSSDPAMPNRYEQDANQGPIFRDDFKRHVYTLLNQVKYEVASLAQCVATIAFSPVAIVTEIYRLLSRSINVSTCLKNILMVPQHIVLSAFSALYYVAESVDGIIAAASTEVGFLAWHAGERVVRLLSGAPHTVLSNSPFTRDIVYHALGLTLLAAGALFIPIAPIQLLALPIILGSIYGTINNQFTVRQCPEYYTMGHHYDGTKLGHHAIKTNNLWIKPIVSGCYATTFITKYAGLVLAAIGTIPFTAAILPGSIAGAMIGGVCAIALIVSHIFATLKKNGLQRKLDEYGKLIGLELNEINRNRSWEDLAESRKLLIEQKRGQLAANPQELKEFDRKLAEFNKVMEVYLDGDIPIKYIPGWESNSTRNGWGYLFAGGGTVAVAVASIFLRIFAL